MKIQSSLGLSPELGLWNANENINLYFITKTAETNKQKTNYNSQMLYYYYAVNRPVLKFSTYPSQQRKNPRRTSDCLNGPRTRVHFLTPVNSGPSTRFPLPELTARVDACVKKCTRVLGPSTRPVNSGSGNRPLTSCLTVFFTSRVIHIHTDWLIHWWPFSVRFCLLFQTVKR